MQAAKIQYLSSLLSSSAGTINATASPSLTPTSTTQDLNPLSLLNSPQMSTPLPSMPSLTDPSQNQFDQIMDAELLPPYLIEQLLCNDSNQSGDFSNVGMNGEGSSTPRTVLESQSSLPRLTDISVSNLGDACSTSSCDISSISSIPFWGSDILLDDQCFLPEFS
jgi:transcription factor MYB, plant